MRGLSLGCALAGATPAQSPPDEPAGWFHEKFIDPEDGKLDASAFLESAYGFVPMGTIITDPAVGYGGGLGLIFIKQNVVDGKAARPDISMLGGFATDNGTWGSVVGDSRNWREGRMKTLAGGFYGSINLEFFGSDELPTGAPLEYNLLAWGAMGEVSTKLGASQAWFGLRYAYADVDVTFDLGNTVPGIDPDDFDQLIAGLTPLLSFDSRDNLFTPTKGVYAEAAVAVYSEVLGGDSDFQIASLSGIWYRPMGERTTLGVKADLSASFDDTPFYLRPYVQLRGLQSLRLQGENAANVEAEVRWQRWTRWSLVGFVGAGAAWKGLTDFEHERDTLTGGAGFRYLAARRFGLHMGMDLAFGPDEPIIYFQFGSAWFRP